MINLLKLLRLAGITTVIGYMVIILYTWMLASHQGYTYFMAGEPVAVIRYAEWILGIIGVSVMVDVYRKEIDSV